MVSQQSKSMLTAVGSVQEHVIFFKRVSGVRPDGQFWATVYPIHNKHYGYHVDPLLDCFRSILIRNRNQVVIWIIDMCFYTLFIGSRNCQMLLVKLRKHCPSNIAKNVSSSMPCRCLALAASSCLSYWLHFAFIRHSGNPGQLKTTKPNIRPVGFHWHSLAVSLTNWRTWLGVSKVCMISILKRLYTLSHFLHIELYCIPNTVECMEPSRIC